MKNVDTVVHATIMGLAIIFVIIVLYSMNIAQSMMIDLSLGLIFISAIISIMFFRQLIGIMVLFFVFSVPLMYMIFNNIVHGFFFGSIITVIFLFYCLLKY